MCPHILYWFRRTVERLHFDVHYEPLIRVAYSHGQGDLSNSLGSDYRRFINVTSTFLSLLVAFLSVMVVGLPQLLDALKPERAQLAMTFRSNNADRISLIVYNDGNVASALEDFAELRILREYLPISVSCVLSGRIISQSS